MTSAWTLVVDRDDLAQTALLEQAVPEVGEGEVLMRVDRVGVTANNVTYAVLGKAFRYWDFFPTEPGRGVVPLWGFAEVVAAAAEGVEVGGRVYGYLPSGSHLLVRPGRADERGFRDASPHRAELPSPYNVYALTTADPVYEADREDLLILYRPLFLTSFMLADQLDDNGYFGAQVLAVSSASSKTAYGAAFLLRDTGPRVVGLTSPGNVAFTESLGCYHEVLPYEEVDRLDPDVPTAYLDFAGSGELRRRVREHLGDRLVHEAIIGVTSQQFAGAEALAGPRTSVFFAPDQMRKRMAEWGRAGLDQRFADAWRRFAPAVEGWVDVDVQHGPDALRDVWLEVLAGRTAPRVGHILTL
jgi:NADPH:quinone reductase-like Zn-dependent oxidoreductase